MKRKKNKNYFLWFFVALVLLSFAFLVFNSYGLLEYWKATKRNATITEQIKKTEKEINKTGLEIDSLKTSEKKIEQIAREKYNMLKPNEEVLKVEKK